jgi:hypothetical protein
MRFQADGEQRHDSPVGQVQRGLRQSGRSGETAGNERLTGATAGVLLVLLAVEGATIVALRPLLSVHVFVGVLLIPPIVLKLASTGYRFVRYYTRHPAYRRQGPPRLLLRLLGPLVVVSTLALFGTGVALIVQGPRAGVILALHKASFVIWFLVMTIHVLAYVLRVPAIVVADWRRPNTVSGSAVRRALLLGSVAAGVVVGIVALPLAHPWIVQMR